MIIAPLSHSQREREIESDREREVEIEEELVKNKLIFTPCQINEYTDTNTSFLVYLHSAAFRAVTCCPCEIFLASGGQKKKKTKKKKTKKDKNKTLEELSVITFRFYESPHAQIHCCFCRCYASGEGLRTFDLSA